MCERPNNRPPLHETAQGYFAEFSILLLWMAKIFIIKYLKENSSEFERDRLCRCKMLDGYLSCSGSGCQIVQLSHHRWVVESPQIGQVPGRDKKVKMLPQLTGLQRHIVALGRQNLSATQYLGTRPR